MSERIPLGRKEDLHLEFKSAEALRKPERIGREVAAMLNADGGEVWVGLRDAESVAVEVEPIANPEREAESLLDSLIDRLEPSPLPQEVRVEPVRLDEGIAVLRIRVAPRPERRPYALIRSGGRHFQVRVGSRIRPLERHEIQEMFRQAADLPPGPPGGAAARQAESLQRIDAAARKWLKDRQRFQDQGRDAMWLGLQPVAEVEIDVQSPVFEELLSDPARTGNRRIGWNFARASEGPGLKRDRVWWRYGTLEASVAAAGGMRFSAALRSLHWKGEEREIWPWALLEYPISAFRLAREIYQDRGDGDDRLIADLAFFGIRGWKLREGSPSAAFFETSEPPIPYPEAGDDLVWEKPLSFSFREIRETPDRCGYRLVRRVYEAFGLSERQMPHDYDRASGRLVLPD